MEKYIKYKRIVEKFTLNNKFQYNTQDFLDRLVAKGYDIIYYDENEEKIINKVPILNVVVLVGKRQNNTV